MGIALIIVLDTENRVLLQHRESKPNISFPNQWGLFGGHIEVGETSHQAAERELKEETGIEGEKLVLLEEGAQVPNRTKKYSFYILKLTSPVAIDLQEGQGYGFFRRDYALEQIDLFDSARFALQRYNNYE